MTKVFDLSRGEYVATYSCSPREAVMAAHGQYGFGNWNTWDYEALYASMVVEGDHTVRCGDFTAMKVAA